MLVLMLLVLFALCAVPQLGHLKPVLPSIGVIDPYPASVLRAGGYSGWFP